MIQKGLRRGILGDARGAALLTLLLLVTVYAASLPYAPLNHGPDRIFLRTPLDRAIPVVPVFALPYVSLTPYIAVSMAALLLVRVRLFRSAAVAMIVAWLVSYAFYFFLQSYVDRPVVTGTDPLSALVRLVYASDQPYNDFPSLHTSLSIIVAIHWWRFDRRAGWGAAAWSVLIIASTLLIHQHYLADVAGGLALGIAASALSLRMLDRELSPQPAS